MAHPLRGSDTPRTWPDVLSRFPPLLGTYPGTHPDRRHDSMRRYIGGQRIYFEQARPWERATIIVDNTNFDDPRTIDADQVSAAS